MSTFPEELPCTFRSEALYSRALGLTPAATRILAKGPGQFVRGVAPKYLARGRGARVWDVDGNEYLDSSMAVGPLSLGYCYPAVDEAIRAQQRFGVRADLACFSKAIANGMPLGLLTGRREVPAQLARLGRRLMDGYNKIARELSLEKATACGASTAGRWSPSTRPTSCACACTSRASSTRWRSCRGSWPPPGAHDLHRTPAEGGVRGARVRTGRPLIVSTGMSTIERIHDGVEEAGRQGLLNRARRLHLPVPGWGSSTCG